MLPRRPIAPPARAALALALLLARPHTAAAQGGAASLEAGNDLFAVRGGGRPPDYDYTAGTRLRFDRRGAPGWARAPLGGAPACGRAAPRAGGCVAAGVGVAQEIYTPRFDTAAGPRAGDRPYAGLLLLDAYARRIAPGRVHTLALRAGVVGPPALAEPAQNGIHRLLHNREEVGWPLQLPTAPVFAVVYDDARLAERPVGPALARGLLGWSASAGTLRTSLGAGARGWIGRATPLPWSPQAPYGAASLGAYLVGGCRGEAVARDVTLDADRRAGGARARRLPFVAECELGAGGRRRAWGVEYRYVVRGREYQAQPNAHAYGAITAVLIR